MSRLDDELKIALRREAPSSDFVGRVMQQIAAQPRRRQSLWERLAAMFQPPRIRWVAIGVTASLIVAIGLLQLGKSQKPVDEQTVIEAVSKPPLPATDAVAGGQASEAGGNNQVGNNQVVLQEHKKAAKVKRIPKQRRPAAGTETVPRNEMNLAADREGEAAKEKVMMALRIASVTLNETQKVIQGRD